MYSGTLFIVYRGRLIALTVLTGLTVLTIVPLITVSNVHIAVSIQTVRTIVSAQIVLDNCLVIYQGCHL